MSIENRQEARERLAAVLAGELGSGATIYDYLPASLGGISPAIAVTSAGATAQRQTPRGGGVEYALDINSFISYEDDAASGYTRRDAENKLDQISKAIERLLLHGSQHEQWVSLRQSGPSTVVVVNLNGDIYLNEIFPVLIQVY